MDIITGIFIIGLVAVVALPIINQSFHNYNRIREKEEMYYLGEMVTERLRAKDNNLNQVFKDLETKDQVLISSIGDINFDKYICQITKTDENNFYISLNILIYYNDERNNFYVEYKRVIPK